MGEANQFYTQVEISNSYVEDIVTYKSIQNDAFDFEGHSLADDIRNGVGKSGYLRVCSSWVRTFWMDADDLKDHLKEEKQTDFSMLSKPSEVFDKCGVYDRDESTENGQGDPISIASNYDQF